MNLPWAACAIGSLVLSLETILPATDCNANGQEDAEDIASGRSQDCNQNQVPDECDVHSRGSTSSAPSGCHSGGTHTPWWPSTSTGTGLRRSP